MASKKKIRRRVFGASCILAALIVAGASFAWFSSSDEVTNQLTATADYGVSIVEDFTPPKDMTPGQEVTKTAAAVNTGNVDAFVRVALENKLNITTYGTQNATDGIPALAYYDINSTKLADDTNGHAYIAYDNLVGATTPDTNAVTLNRTPSVTTTTGVLKPDEVTTLQAGGQLVVAANNGLPITQQFVQSGDYISTAGLTFGEFNADGEFLPKQSGVYLFRRHIGTTTEYSGYYYVAATGDTGGQGTYYALDTKYDTTDPKNPKSTVYVNATITETPTGDGSVVSAISNLKLKTTTTQDAATTAANLTYSFGYIGTSSDTSKKPNEMTVSASVASPAAEAVTFRTSTDVANQKYIEVKYVNGANNEVRFYIELADNWSNKWQFVDNTATAGTNLADYFYLKDDLEAGKTSPTLIKSVTMNPYANQSNFVDLTYDLKVGIDSVQVTYDADNKETADAVSAWTGVTAGLTHTDKEITAIDWS